VDFEFDENKSAANFAKHGINFPDAKALWNDDNLIEIPANSLDEERYLVIGKMAGKHYSGVITYRKGNIRIISVRHSSKKEIEIYENYLGKV
jgi:uncharacterized DUF497 family protein